MNRDIELRHLRYFIAVGDHLHFGRAASALGIAQPPLSQQILVLEQRLGYKLFQRTTRGVQLTEAGAVLRVRAQALLSRLAEDLAATQRVASGVEGSLRVSFSGSAMFHHLPLAIKRFRSKYPNVELILHEMVTAEQERALLDKNLDVAIMRDGPIVEGHNSTIIAREAFVVIFPRGHELAAKTLISPSLLKAENFILFDRQKGQLAYDRIVACCHDYGFEPRVVQNAPQWTTVTSLVAAGLGIAIAPASIRKLRLPGVVFRPIQTPHRSQIDAVSRKGDMEPRVKHFVLLLRQSFAENVRGLSQGDSVGRISP